MQEPKQETFRPIEGKVAKILNDRELAINRGSNHGVETDMIFKVLEESGEIMDPETGESIGSIKRDKIKVKIVHVQPSLSIGRTFATYREPRPWSLAEALVPRPRNITKVQTIRSSKDTYNADATVDSGETIIQTE